MTITPITIAGAADRIRTTAWAVYKFTEKGKPPYAHPYGVRFVALEDLGSVRDAA